MDHSQDQERPQPVTPASGEPVEDDQLSPRAWLMRNGLYLALFVGLFVLLHRYFGLDGMWNLVKAGLGLGLVIFIHELGHFAVAKWCDVHVQTFSIGFGPALPGCSFKYGETSYKLALFPLGGYVKMVGEGDNDPESVEDPRSFKNKSVGQRMAIISAGVVMNMLLAAVCFIVVFSHGKQREPAVADIIDTSGKAYEAGIPTGAQFVQIGSREAEKGHPLYFEDLRIKVALSLDAPMIFGWVVPPGKKVFDAEIVPFRGEDELRPVIGVSSPPSLKLRRVELLGKQRPYPVRYASPAAAARSAAVFRPGDLIVAVTDPEAPGRRLELKHSVALGTRTRPEEVFELGQILQKLVGKKLTVWVHRGEVGNTSEVELDVPPAHFESGDTIVATTDPDDPAKVTDIPLDPRLPENSRAGDIFTFYQRQERLAGQLMTMRVRRANGDVDDLLVPPAYSVTLGARMKMGKITNIRRDSPGARAGVQRDDILAAVTLSSGTEKKEFVIADPLRLPDELRQWAEARREKDKGGVKAQLTVLREDPQTHEASKQKPLPEVDWDFGRRFDRELPLGTSAPWPIPELGIAYQIKATVEAIEGPPASAPEGLRADDVIKEVRFRELGDEWGEGKEGKWFKLKPEDDPDQWASIFFVLQQQAEFKELSLRVKRSGKMEEVTLTLQPDPTWPLADRGLLLEPAKVIQKADGPFDALVMGLEDTGNNLAQVYLFIRGILMQRLSPKNLGGPITIGVIAYKVAQMDFYEFLFFLGMISINLAAFNFLPIPVLDGGHMVFLIYEKLRGKQASESVQWGALVVGLVLLGLLMLFVFWQDTVRWILP